MINNDRELGAVYAKCQELGLDANEADCAEIIRAFYHIRRRRFEIRVDGKFSRWSYGNETSDKQLELIMQNMTIGETKRCFCNNINYEIFRKQ